MLVRPFFSNFAVMKRVNFNRRHREMTKAEIKRNDWD